MTVSPYRIIFMKEFSSITHVCYIAVSNFSIPFNFSQQIGAEIGRGGNAVVYQAFNVETGDFVAVKRIPLNAVDDGTFTCIQVNIESIKTTMIDCNACGIN